MNDRGIGSHAKSPLLMVENISGLNLDALCTGQAFYSFSLKDFFRASKVFKSKQWFKHDAWVGGQINEVPEPFDYFFNISSIFQTLIAVKQRAFFKFP